MKEVISGAWKGFISYFSGRPDSRDLELANLREEKSRLVVTIENQGVINSGLRSAISDLNQNYTELQEREIAMQRELDEKDKQLQTNQEGIKHFKDEKRRFQVLSVQSGRAYLELLKHNIELGYNPFESDRDGRYALIGTNGRVVAMSKKVQRLFGYKPGEVDYDVILSPETVAGLGDLSEEKMIEELPVRLAEQDFYIKNVHIRPVPPGGDYKLGVFVDFGLENFHAIKQFRRSISSKAKKLAQSENARIKTGVAEVIRRSEEAVYGKGLRPS